MRINSEAVIPTRSVSTGIGFEGKNLNQAGSEEKTLKASSKKVQKISEIFPTYGSDGKINNTEKIGGLVDSNF